MFKRVTLAAAVFACNCSGDDTLLEDVASQTDELRNCSEVHGNDYLNVINAYLNGPGRTEWTSADCKLMAPIWTGDDDKGQLFSPLWRGPGGGIDDWVPAPPSGNCDGLKGTVRIDWDRAQNTVHYRIKLSNVPVSPTITRIDGGDPEILDPQNPNHYKPPGQATWWYNPFHRAPKDFPIIPSDGTAYRLWTVFTTFNTQQAPFYYDAQTLLLKGSVAEYPNGQPPNTIPVSFGNAAIYASALIYPNRKGFASRDYTVPYNQVTSEGGYWSYSATTFVPINLCRSLQYQPVLGQLRPYSPPLLPASQGQPFDFILRQGIGFDLTIEEGRPDVAPGGDDINSDYIYSGLGFLQNNPAVGGGVPWGWHASLPNAIQNVQPAIEPVPRCEGFLSNPHVTAPLFCQGQSSL